MDDLMTINVELNAWLDQNWSPDHSLVEWRDLLVDGGWAAPGWPRAYFGRDFSPEQSALVEAEFARRGIVGAAQSGPRRLAAETILAHGSEDQKQRYLRPILTGQDAWCQLFSEPGSGSDLAGSSTRAELHGDRYVINGQKVWTTSAHHADFGILLARTDWDVPKHQGLSYFLFNMRQSGVEVRPLRQMNAHASFNEVFMTDASVDSRDLIGGEGNGWRVAATTLSIERQGFSRSRPDGGLKGLSSLQGRVYDEYRAELLIALEPYTWYPQRAGRTDLALPRARQTGAINDPHIRQELAKLLSMQLGADLAAASATALSRAGSNTVSPQGSIGKLAASVIARQAAHVHTLVAGTDAMLSGAASAEAGVIAEILLSVPAISIAGGTDEIQKNIIAERVLEMPKEPRSDTGPFRAIARNSADK
ncbi:acyl-CoA dehydrogenase family protein [Pseudomonadales bacterium]|nr:acyl-CoA dehydrogenase family protein [Pseudomonadales bacterium]MDB9917773.1 acyl-CoA dehydrogenase family protein [Pseudomonadales bacterium]MDB9941966.1 acyl-CoA dehydrogenase family protein [Pseudomonadales bacterium]MDC1307714.1 acyl-CoA dehydrogenase family protein [Pseudomonadales bacterium]